MTAPDDARKEEEISKAFGGEMAIIQAAVRALRESVGMSQYGRAEVILAAVTPLIRAAALEQAAKVADDFSLTENSDPHLGPDIAAAIRALKQEPK